MQSFGSNFSNESKNCIFKCSTVRHFLRFWHNCSTVLSIHPEFGGIATMKLIKSHKAGYCIFFVWSWVLGEIDIFDCRSVLAILFIKVPLLFIKEPHRSLVSTCFSVRFRDCSNKCKNLCQMH